MVLSATRILSKGYGSVCKGQVNKGQTIQALSSFELRNIYFKLCKACQLSNMASIPPSAFNAGRIRETQRDSRDMKLSNTHKSSGSGKFFNTFRKEFNDYVMELSPLKYNSMLMNSIWGRYNRYSPHNVKKVNDAHPMTAELQQHNKAYQKAAKVDYLVGLSAYSSNEFHNWDRENKEARKRGGRGLRLSTLLHIKSGVWYKMTPEPASNSAKNEPLITLPSAKLDNVWAAINVSQSH